MDPHPSPNESYKERRYSSSSGGQLPLADSNLVEGDHVGRPVLWLSDDGAEVGGVVGTGEFDEIIFTSLGNNVGMTFSYDEVVGLRVGI